MVSLKDIYDRFTNQPSDDDLVHDGADATLTYVTSGITLCGAGEVVEFVARSRRQVQLTETVVACHVALDSLTLEVAAECKFKNGGSWIAPGIEANLIDGVVVKIALVKCVEFCGDKIRAMRVYWDQATVLKQLEIVGSRGRGWPITDGPKQIDLINKSVFSSPASRPQPKAQPSKPQPVADDPNATPKPKTPARRTYSITNDIEIDPQEIKRLPRQGWQSNRQAFRLDEEGDVPLKGQSPVRLPRAGQAPRREFSFSNLSQAYKAGENPTKKAGHLEFDDEVPPVPSLTKASIGGGTGGRVDPVFPGGLGQEGNNSVVKPSIGGGTGGRRIETIFHDADETPRDALKPSIGGGTGGRRPEETIFLELEEDPSLPVERKKTPVTRRDQQIHFSFSDESPSTPVANKTTTLPHIIEGTPDPMESEYSARALQRKEMNHFRPDTVSHFEIVDEPTAQMRPEPKKENTEGMNKLLKGIARNWAITDSPSPATRTASSVPKKDKDLAPHFSFGDSPVKNDDEKENGRGSHGQKRMHVPVKTDEKEWWET